MEQNYTHSEWVILKLVHDFSVFKRENKQPNKK